MPKKLLELRTFNVGTVTSVDAGDIPAEAASFSLNIDSHASGGVLQGVPTDLQVVLLALSNVTEGGTNVLYPTQGDMHFLTIDGYDHYVVYDGGWQVASFSGVITEGLI